MSRKRPTFVVLSRAMLTANGKLAGGSGTKLEYKGVLPHNAVVTPPGAALLIPIELTDAEQLREILWESEEQSVLVYKHSVSCPISGYAWHEVQNCLDLGDDASTCYRVTVQYHPELSREIALMLDVIHHTPQVIIVRNGKAGYVASHWQIKKQALQRALMDGAQLPEKS